MALKFSQGQQERGHPITVWLNDKAVLVASKDDATFAPQRALLAELMAKGAEVIICPFCMQHYGMAETALMEGVKVGNPDLTGAALFRDDTRTLTW
jgi:intracellular sulfur oxidation DsrE/DsrF family protein